MAALALRSGMAAMVQGGAQAMEAAREREAGLRWSWPDPFETAACAWDVTRAHWLAPAAIESLARRRWLALVEFARERSPFYRQHYADVDAGDPQLLPHLPPVTKKLLMADLDRVFTVAALRGQALRQFVEDPARIGLPFAGDCAVWTSSGTSGEPGVFVHDRHALAVYDALQLFRFRGASASVEGRVLPFAAERFALVAATGGHFAGAASIERLRRTFPWLKAQLRVISLMQPLPGVVAELDAYRPDVLATYPTMASLLAEEQRAGRLNIAPAQVWTGGEGLTDAARARIEEGFGALVREEYGASEFPSIAVGCPEGWLHVNADWVVLEAIGAQGQPVAPGELSSTVLLTNLANRAQPLIRYDLGDAVTLRPDACPCGNRFPALRVQGRTDDPLALQSESGASVTLLPLALTTVLEEGAGVYEFQLVRSGPRSLDLRLGRSEECRAQAALAALKVYLGQQALSGVEVRHDTQVPRRDLPGGKLRRILAGSDPI
jgi:phenylacetate-coenzyme A ligase PaaK-like adenylate-forming protein